MNNYDLKNPFKKEIYRERHVEAERLEQITDVNNYDTKNLVKKEIDMERPC